MAEMSSYEFEADFDKAKLVELAKELGAILDKEALSPTIVSLGPWRIHYMIRSLRSDFSDIIASVYMRPEVLYVEMNNDPVMKAPVMQVFMKERWFEEGKKNVQKRSHPESEGGALA